MMKTGFYGNRIRSARRLRDLLIIGALICALVSSQIFVVFADDGQAGAEASVSDVALIEEVTETPIFGAEFDGYIVSVESAKDVDKSALRETADAVIDSTTAVIARPEDVLDYTDAENVTIIEPNYKLTSFGDFSGTSTLEGGLSGMSDWVDPDEEDTSTTDETPIITVNTAKFPDADPADPIYRDVNDYQWGLKTIKANAAWKNGYRGKGVTVAVLDTGLNSNHEDIDKSNITGGKKFFGGGEGASKDYSDDNGHGTYVASIIAAQVNNLPGGKGLGMAGIADEANLVIYKVLGKQGEGYVSDLISAYTALLTAKVDVVNMSFGHPGYLAQEDEIVQKLIAKGIIIIAAVGNDGNASGALKNQICYPANYDNVIGVGSCRSDGKVSGFSTKNKSVDVSAPGEDMAGLSYDKNNVYKVGGDGTSFAAPVVAAAAAISREIDPKLTADSFLTLLKSTVKDAGTKGYDTSFGYGVLDISAIIKSLEKSTGVSSSTGIGATGADKSSVKISSRAILVKFNANKGKVSTKNKAVFVGKKYGKLPKPTKKGYKFLGWYTKKKGGSKIITSKKVTVKKTQILYAHWKKVAKKRAGKK